MRRQRRGRRGKAQRRYRGIPGIPDYTEWCNLLSPCERAEDLIRIRGVDEAEHAKGDLQEPRGGEV